MNIPQILKLTKSLKLCLNHQKNLKLVVNINKKTEILPPSVRQISTFEAKSIQNNESLVKKFLNKIPFINLNKHKMMVTGYYLYERIADKINYIDFFEEVQLPDTFYSWFVITELHIWILSVRLMAEGDEGRGIRNNVISALWADVEQRVKKLGASNSSMTKQQISELSEQLQAALIAYDEGLLSDDSTLAGAIWRRFYQCNEVSPENLDVLVKYVRRQCRLLDNLSKEQIVERREITWEPIAKIKTYH